MENKKRNSKGLSLIEASMVLALSAIVMSGVMVYYQSASENNKVQDTMTLVMGAASTLQAAYDNNPKMVADENLDILLLTSSAIPAKYKNSTDESLTNPFGGRFGFSGATAEAGGVNSVAELRIDGLPLNACMTLATMDLGGIHRGTSVDKKNSFGLSVDKKLYTPSKAAEECRKKQEESSNKLLSVTYFIAMNSGVATN